MYDLFRKATPAHATNPNRFKTDCPFCGKEDHFYFDIKTRKGICFKCMDHYITLGGEFSITQADAPSRDLQELRDSLDKVFQPLSEETISIDIDAFSEPINPKRHPKSLKYLLEDRFLTMEDIKKYDIRSGISYRDKDDRLITKWTGRVVFPFYENGICTYAIGRSYMGSEKKYVNVDTPKTSIVYGLDHIKNRECIICEGLLSAIAAEKSTGISSVCLLGKTISPIQLYKIRKSADRIWQSLDGGVPEKQIKSMARRFIRAGFEELWMVNLPGKGDVDIHGNVCDKDYDPDDLGDEYLLYFDKAERIRLL